MLGVRVDSHKPIELTRTPRKIINFDINEITAQLVTKDKRDLGFLERKDIVEVTFEFISDNRSGI